MIELLRHPLTVLLVGALISGLLIPAFTRRWQNHQKALEIKTELVSELSKSIMGIIMAIQFVRVGAKSQKQADFDQAYREWEIESAEDNDASVQAVLLDSLRDTGDDGASLVPHPDSELEELFRKKMADWPAKYPIVGGRSADLRSRGARR
jgi:hypothetical protein